MSPDAAFVVRTSRARAQTVHARLLAESAGPSGNDIAQYNIIVFSSIGLVVSFYFAIMVMVNMVRATTAEHARARASRRPVSSREPPDRTLAENTRALPSCVGRPHHTLAPSPCATGRHERLAAVCQGEGRVKPPRRAP